MNKTNRILKIAVVVLVIGLLFSFAEINELKSEISNLQNSLNNNVNTLQNQINSIYNNVDEKLEQQASLITKFDFEYGELDTETMQVPISVKITPKTVSAETELSLDLGGRTVTMKRGDGTEFTAKFKTKLFHDYENTNVKLIIKNGEVSQSEELDWSIDGIYSDYIPSLWSHLVFDETGFTEENGLKIEGDILLESFDENKKDFKNITMYFDMNGKILSVDDISSYFEEDSSFTTIPINKNFPEAKQGDKFTLYITAEDKFGYIHKNILKSMICTSESETIEEVWADSEIILDKQGNVLYGGKE